ncbi:hypothetical protein V8J36_00495 [Frigidibacter sp. MR17.14]|uniref:hypothetical protein n=1 Tax=Frigidibacter sp. MR17.14 TaxID=3126509 RepID=UPI003012CE81
MLIDLIAMIAIGAFIIGVYLLANRVAGRRLPKWLMPAAIGAAVISFAVWNEYTWYGRVTSALPDTVAVVMPVTESNLWRPWTYVAPVTTRFIAVDRGAVQRSEARPELVRTEALLVQRWAGTQRVPVAFDCAGDRRADLVAASLGADGTLTGGAWQPVAADDPMLRAACGQG